MTALNDGRGDQDGSAGVSSIMAQSVADVRIPADMLDRAVRRNRKRTARNRLLSVAGTVAAAATAVVLTLPGGAAADHTRVGQSAAEPRMQTDGYVLTRATEAQANTRTMISVTHSSDGTTYTDVATQQQRYDAALRASDGQPYFQWVDTVSNGTWTETMIVNQDRVYSVQTDSSSANPTIAPPLPLQGQSDPLADFNTTLKQGLVKVVGHRDLDGRDTILLRYKVGSSPCGAKPAICAKKAAMGTAPVQPDDEVWIDANTYLVVQIQSSLLTKQGQAFGWSPSITTIRWLPATSSNLALLAIVPPPGYAKVPQTAMAKYLGPVS